MLVLMLKKLTVKSLNSQEQVAHVVTVNSKHLCLWQNLVCNCFYSAISSGYDEGVHNSHLSPIVQCFPILTKEFGDDQAATQT